jgi:hypothetical protein
MGALLYGFWGCYVFFLTIYLTELLISYSERLVLENENHHLSTECSNVVRGSQDDPPTEYEAFGRANQTG